MGGVAGKERGEQPLNAKAPPPTPQGQGEQRRIKNIEKYKKRTKKKRLKRHGGDNAQKKKKKL